MCSVHYRAYMVVPPRIELGFNDYKSFGLPLTYRTIGGSYSRTLPNDFDVEVTPQLHRNNIGNLIE